MGSNPTIVPEEVTPEEEEEEEVNTEPQIPSEE